MPRVPTYDNLQVTPSSMPGQRLDAPVTPEIASLPAKQLGQLGDAVQKAGSAGATIFIDLQKQANDARVQEAVEKFREQELKLTYDKDVGFLNQRGSSAFQRESGKSLQDDYIETLNKKYDEIYGGLGNDAQKLMFKEQADRIKVNFGAQATKHEADEFYHFQKSVKDSVISNGLNEIGLRYNDPVAVDEAVNRVKQAAYDKAMMESNSAQFAEVQAKKALSDAHKVAISTAIEKNNVAYAEGYKNKYKDQMQANDLLYVEGLVTKEMDKKVGFQTAQTVINENLPKMMTSNIDRAFNIAIGSESSGRQFDAAGNPLKSSKGAIGKAQILPSTGPEAAKLAGLEWDEERFYNDEKYNETLGKAYFEKQLKDFNGRIDLAYAAYNAGPRAVREAMEKAVKDSQIPSANAGKMKSYLEYLPTETQNYVEKNMKAYNSGQGEFEKPSLLEIHRQVRDSLGPDASTDRVKIAVDEASRQYDQIEKAIKQKDDATVANAMKMIVANGGDYAALPAALQAAIPPKELSGVMKFANDIRNGDDHTNEALYLQLTQYPEQLKSMSDDEFYRLRSELSQSDFKHFANERSKQITGRSSDKFDDINSASVKSIVNNRLMSLGIDPSPKDTNKSEMMRVSSVFKYVNDAVIEKQMQDGKKMSDAELEKFIDKLFAQSTMTKGGWFSSDKQGRMLNMKASDIPTDVRKLIEQDFNNRGIEPTDSDVLNAYWMLESKKKKQSSGATGKW